MTGFLNGIATAMITPFAEDKVNFNELERMIEYQIAGGTDALVVLGTTGEPATMTEDEKENVMRFAIDAAHGRIKIIVGTGSNDTKKAVAASQKAEKAGADGVLAVTPYYNKCTQRGLFEYYDEICRAVDVPVIAYNVPSRTGVNILPETAARIAEIKNMAGIKEASGNMAQAVETMRLIRGKTDLFSGEDALNLPIYAIGGAGAVSVVSNIAPSLVKKVYEAVKQNKLEEANELNERLLPLCSACFIEVNPIPVKAGCEMIGFKAGNPRPPLTRLEESHREILKNAILNAGVKAYD